MALPAVLGAAGQSYAENTIPSPLVQEVLIKSNLVSLNDAVVTGNYDVMHEKMSKPFRDQFPMEKFKLLFKDFVDKHAVFDVVVAKPVVPDSEAKIDADGVLRLSGHFDTTPKQVKYRLGFIPSEGLWKLVAIKVDIE